MFEFMLSGLRCSMSTQKALTSYEVRMCNSRWTLVFTKTIDLNSGFLQIPKYLLTVNIGLYICLASAVWFITRMGQVNMLVTHPQRKPMCLLMSSRFNSHLAILSVDFSAGSLHSQLPGCSTGSQGKQKANLTFSRSLNVASIK